MTQAPLTASCLEVWIQPWGTEGTTVAQLEFEAFGSDSNARVTHVPVKSRIAIANRKPSSTFGMHVRKSLIKCPDPSLTGAPNSPRKLQSSDSSRAPAPASPPSPNTTRPHVETCTFRTTSVSKVEGIQRKTKVRGTSKLYAFDCSADLFQSPASLQTAGIQSQRAQPSTACQLEGGLVRHAVAPARQVGERTTGKCPHAARFAEQSLDGL